MKQSLNIGKEPNFQKIIITSAVMHLLFIALVAVPIKTKEREYKSYFVNLVGPAEIRRSTRTPALKKSVKNKTEKRAIKIKPGLKKRVKPKSKADMSLEPADRVAKEIERLSAISALTKQKKQREREIAKSKKTDEAISGAIDSIRKKVRGRISIGPGAPASMSSVASEPYHALVFRKIQNEWVHPGFDSDYEAIISIKMDKEGSVIFHKIEKPSGNNQFDRTAVKAILKASPLPPHPVEREIVLRFRY